MTNDSNPPTITEFLLARIAEDEAKADEMESTAWYEGGWATEDADRLRKDCAAKRAIIGSYEPTISHPHPEAARYPHAYADDVCQVQVGDRVYDAAFLPEELQKSWSLIFPMPETLRHLAAIYADHPDYQQDWAL